MALLLNSKIRIFFRQSIKYTLMIGVVITTLYFNHAYADTATFTSDDDVITDLDIQRMTSVNSDGYIIGRGDTLFIELENDVFSSSAQDDLLTIYHSNDFLSRFTISVGYEINGVVEWSQSQRFWAWGTGSVDVSNFANHCSVAGGCSFISITAHNWRRGAFELDAVAVNGELISGAASTTPEPAAWALMCLGFILMAWRLKKHKSANHHIRKNKPPPNMIIEMNHSVIT